MPTIEGPVTITAEVVDESVLKGLSNVKLPFEASGWTSEYNADLVTGGVKAQKVKKRSKAKKK